MTQLFFTTILATPALAAPVRADDCPASTALTWDGVTVSWSHVAKDTFFDASGAGISMRYDWSRGTSLVGVEAPFGIWSSGTLRARERFRVLGPAAGTPVSVAIEFVVKHDPTPLWYDLYTYATSLARISVDGEVLASTSSEASCYAYECTRTGPTDTTLSVPVSAMAGSPFVVEALLQGVAGGELSSSVGVSGRFRFRSLPPGTFVASCHLDSVPYTLQAVSEASGGGLRLVGVGANPTRGPIEVAFDAVPGGQVVLHLLDVAGRVLESSIQDANGVSRRTVQFDRERRLAPGTYFVRARRGAVADVRAVTILR